MSDFKELIKTLIDELEDPFSIYLRECEEEGIKPTQFGPYMWERSVHKTTFRKFLRGLSQFIEKGEEDGN